MNEQITITSGLKTYDLVNEKKELLGQITFNPSDMNIVNRHQEVIKSLNELKKEFSNKSENKSTYEQIEELDNIVYEKFDYLFGAKVSDVIFSIMGPFSVLESGQLFFEHVLNAISAVIEADANKKAKKALSKIKKYTQKYHN
ncbi:MAG: hypothetical protein J6C12_04145 [Lachnospiraceae bacterium]|nr:hypothetical protein [Lachnospiraceae bacterium]